jgi:hypothetical protein
MGLLRANATFRHFAVASWANAGGRSIRVTNVRVLRRFVDDNRTDWPRRRRPQSVTAPQVAVSARRAT